MATVFESISLEGLRSQHLDQLRWYIKKISQAGDYYGQKKHFDKRHKELRQWVDNAWLYAQSPDVVFPSKSTK